MEVIPAIDVTGGRIAPAATSVLGTSDPVAAARGWASLGFAMLHVNDTDAVAGRGSSAAAIEDAVRDHALDLQVAVCADSDSGIETWVDAGAARVVLDPSAVSDLDWLVLTAESFPDSLILQTAVRARRVVTRGWVHTLPVDLLDLVRELAGVPLAAILVTAVDADASSGVDLALLEDVVDAAGCPVFTEGPAATLNGLLLLEERGVAGVVVPEAAFSSGLDARRVASRFAP